MIPAAPPPGAVPSFAMDEVVAAAYEAAAGVRPWRDACDAVCAAMDLWCVQILGMLRRSGALTFTLEGGPRAPEAALQHLTRYHAIDPRLSLLPHLRVGDWVHDHEHFDDDFVARSPYFQEYLIPLGGRHASTTLLFADEERLVLLTLIRGVGRPPLDDDQVARVERIRVHLERAVRIHLRRQASRPISVAGHTLLEVMPQGVMIVDAARRITYRNPAAAELIASGTTLVDRGGHLDGAHLRGSRALASAIQSLALGSARQPEARPVLGTVARTGAHADADVQADAGAAGGCETGAASEGDARASAGARSDRALLRIDGSAGAAGLLVFAIAVRPDEVLRSFGDEACAILVVHPLDAPTRLDPLIVSLAFGLSPAEARVATAIAEGASPEEVARSRGVGLTTVRTQLRGVFEKMGVRRQSEMVRMLLELPRLRPATAGLSARIQ